MYWPGDPVAILDGPRGRRLCWQLAWSPGSLPPGWQALAHMRREVSPDQLAAELTSGSMAAAEQLDSLSPAVALAALEESVSWARYWQEPDDIDRALSHPDVASAMLPLATGLAALPVTSWWSAAMDVPDQHTVVFDGEPRLPAPVPDLARWRKETFADEQRAAERPSDPTANWSGSWWSAPVMAGLWATTRALPDLGPVGLHLVEDEQGWKAATSRRVSVPADARTFEITGPRAWARLVARYPLDVSGSRRHDWWRATGRAGTWLIPDYLAIAADFDAIHLTVAGYLTTAGRAVDVGAGAASVLAGWDPDKTYFLIDPIRPAEPPQHWVTKGAPCPPRWTAAD